MPLKKTTNADLTSDIRAEDAQFFLKCFQHSTTDTVINTTEVGAALDVKPHTIYCRIQKLKADYNLNVRCSSHGGGGGGSAPPTPLRSRASKNVKAADGASPAKVEKGKKENGSPAKKKGVMKALSGVLANGQGGAADGKIKDEVLEQDGLDTMSNGEEAEFGEEAEN